MNFEYQIMVRLNDITRESFEAALYAINDDMIVLSTGFYGIVSVTCDTEVLALMKTVEIIYSLNMGKIEEIRMIGDVRVQTT